jgi:hypothetical protein
LKEYGNARKGKKQHIGYYYRQGHPSDSSITCPYSEPFYTFPHKEVAILKDNRLHPLADVWLMVFY